jgi:hypothetical protein
MPICGSMYVRSAHINKAVNEEVVDLCRVISLRVSNWSFLMLSKVFDFLPKAWRIL